MMEEEKIELENARAQKAGAAAAAAVAAAAAAEEEDDDDDDDDEEEEEEEEGVTSSPFLPFPPPLPLVRTFEESSNHHLNPSCLVLG